MMSCWRSQSAAVVSSRGFESEIPALLTTRSDAAERERGGPERGLDLLLGGHVDGDGERLVAAAQFGCEGVRFGPVAVRDDHAGALGGQSARRGPADPGGGSGHQRDPARPAAAAAAAAAAWPSSSAQYSIRNFSDSSVGVYEETASAPRITVTAFR